jgi:hypothetical protein
MSSEYYPYLVSKVAETKAQPAAGWAVGQVVAAAVQPPIAAAAINSCSSENPGFRLSAISYQRLALSKIHMKNMRLGRSLTAEC